MVLSPVNNKARLWLSGRKNVYAGIQTFAGINQKKIIWCHCASLGEFEQARPLLERIQEQYPSYAILLSFFSPSGFEISKNYPGAAFVTYLPMDGEKNAARFLALVKPSLVIWVKYEYWHFYLQAIRQKNIPLLLVSGIFRPGQPFFKSWGHFHRSMLHCFSQLFVQNQASQQLLAGIGISNVLVSGDTRFDRVMEIAQRPEAITAVEKFINGAPVIVAGSTWEADEEELDHFANTHPEIRFIIAPHEIDEEHLEEIGQLFHRSVRYSAWTNDNYTVDTKIPEPTVLIIDNIGMLSRLYQYASIAYVGGGFGNDGVHNVLEAAVYHKPVVFGPVFEKFAEAVELVDAGAAFDVENALELEEILQLLLQKGPDYTAACEAAGRYTQGNTGATKKILAYIQENRLLTN